MYVVNAVGLPFFALRYWYGGFGTGTPLSNLYPITTGISYTMAFIWVVLVCCARLYSGISSPADVQGGLLVGGVLVRAWLPVCDQVNQWILADAVDPVFGMPQWAALISLAIVLMMIHPYTPGDARSWVALTNSTKAVAFGTAFLIGSNACSRLKYNTNLPEVTMYNAGTLLVRNAIGFLGMRTAWRLSRTASMLVEKLLQPAAHLRY